MSTFSSIEHAMQRFQRDVVERDALLPAPPWNDADRTEEKRAKRIKISQDDFWAFDRLYFTKDMYPDGYSKPNRMLLDMVGHCTTPGVKVVLGPRGHGKTITAKKLLVWLLLTNRVQIAGTYSHTMPTSSNILADVVDLMKDNPRLSEDYGIEFAEDNDLQCRFRTTTHRHYRYVAAFSEGRSVRGYSRMFGRPQFVLGDDIETLNSPLSDTHSAERIDKVDEAYKTLVDSGTFVWLGNNFSESCATNKLLSEQDAGDLEEHWAVHVYDAWDDDLEEPLWVDRYGRIDEAELQRRCRAKDSADWAGNFRQRPKPKDGDRYPREFYSTFKHVADDAKGVIYCDPNLALKGKGDETAIIAYLYSPELNEFYVAAYLLKSFSSSNDLLNAVLNMRALFPSGTIFRIGFDGNVNQESNWTNNIRNFCLQHGMAFPHVEYLKLNVDLFSKNAEVYWEQRKILFPEGTRNTPMGKRAVDSLCTFVSKKLKRKDDFPDALINAHELICATGFVRPKATKTTPEAVGIEDHYKM